MISRFNPPKGQKFTLIELLIAIALIGILAAMLLPTFNNILNRACAISNGNRLKQIGLGCIIFSSDNNNSWPSTITELVPKYISADVASSLNGKAFTIVDSTVTSDSGSTDRVITDNSIAGYTNILYADGHVEMGLFDDIVQFNLYTRPALFDSTNIHEYGDICNIEWVEGEMGYIIVQSRDTPKFKFNQPDNTVTGSWLTNKGASWAWDSNETSYKFNVDYTGRASIQIDGVRVWWSDYIDDASVFEGLPQELRNNFDFVE